MSDTETKTERNGVKHSDVLDAVSDRSKWAQRIAIYEQMRTEGLRRKSQPWANAADMHFPLVDMQVEKNKPYYIEQALSRETIASFTAMTQELSNEVVNVERWFDWQLRQQSNFCEFVELATDKMLMFGREPVRVIWDANKKRVVFEALDPTRVIVPSWTKKIEDADWIVLVMEFSKFAYKRNKQFNQDDDFIRRISGSGDEHEQQQLNDVRKSAEGITHSSNHDSVIVWELYVRTENGWHIHTYSPLAPDDDVRPPRALPYTEGVFSEKGGNMPPFASLSCEGRNEQWASPRGLAQKLAPFEASLCADWNSQKDWQRLSSQPLFSAPGGLPNNANIRFVPGQILPFDIQAVQFPPAPLDIAAQMSQTRATGEQLIGTPDFALGNDAQTGGGKGSKTATEVQTLSAVMGAGIGMRGRRFRRELSVILSLAWSLHLQYSKKSLTFQFRGQAAQMNPAFLKDGYLVQLSGTGDDLRTFRIQKAYQRMQTFGNNPSINQRELVRSALEEDDPRLIDRLLLDQDAQAADQAEDQAAEIGIMLIGYPARVKPTDDHATHFQILAQYLQRKMQTNEVITPEFAANAAAHAMAHFQYLQKTNPQAAQQFAPAMQEFQAMGNAALAVIQNQAAAQQQAQQQSKQPEIPQQ